MIFIKGDRQRTNSLYDNIFDAFIRQLINGLMPFVVYRCSCHDKLWMENK